MASRIITAPDDIQATNSLEGPLVYLHGPIQGACHWQTDAIDVLVRLAPHLTVASPRALAFQGNNEAHLAWEQAFLERAARHGVILFWLARETQHRCNRSYASQVRFDLGEWAARSRAQARACIVVGIERGFTGRVHLERRLTQTYPHIPICRTLRQTCTAAVEFTAPREVPRSLSERFVPSSGLHTPE